MSTHPAITKSAWTFFGLVFLLALPFWLVGPIAERFLPWETPINLPFSALIFVVPLLAASILTYREHGFDGVKALLTRVADYRQIKPWTWYIPIFGLLPATYALAYGLMRATGASLPENPLFPIAMAPVFFVVFFVTATAEEVGWSGYAVDRLQGRWTALGAGLIIGVVWALIHIVPDLQAHHTLTWITWQRLSTILLRILIVWLYNNTGRSVFAAIGFHTMDNVSVFLFPNYGSHYDPFFVWILLALIVATVAYLWGPKTLARYRFAV